MYEQVHSFGLGADGSAYPAATPLIGLDGHLYGTTVGGGSWNAGTIFRVEVNGGGFTVLHSFGGTDGQKPLGALVQDEAGVLYGVAGGGHTGTNGVVFRIKSDGSDFAIIKELAADGSEGREPSGGLMRASHGILYGTAYSGGAHDGGTVFSLRTDGTGFAVLREFGDRPDDGLNPRCFVVEGADGVLYGTTRNGGTAGAGTVFRMTRSGSGYEVLRSFVPATEGAQPLAGLLVGKDGRLYGTLASGGTGGGGAAYALNPDGTGFTTLHSFRSGDLSSIMAGICQTTDRLLYTITTSGGTSGKGAVVRFREDGSDFAIIREFGAAPDEPNMGITSLVQVPDGRLYFSTFLGGTFGNGTLVRMLTDGNNLEIVTAFLQPGSAAVTPRSELAVGTGGDLFGTTYGGGPGGRGTVFRIRSDGSAYQTLYSFGQTANDAAAPMVGIRQAGDGRLYGTTVAGGAANQGALYRLNPDGSGYEVIHSFRGAPTDGAAPSARLVDGDDGLLYGVTSSGGAATYGTVFRTRQDGTGYQVLRSLQGGPSDGASPYGELLRTRAGVLYGVTYSGGSGNVGTVFRLNPDGSGYTVLKSFSLATGSPSNPWAGLLEGSDGRLYGTSVGSGGGGGTVFSLAPDGTDLKVLVAFPQPAGGGVQPTAKLVEDSTGWLWGVCWQGGAESSGTVFRLRKDGSEYQVVHDFAGSPAEGSGPLAGLTIFADGVVYGTTTAGGVANFGSVFRISSGGNVWITGISKEAGGPAVVRLQAVPGWLCSLESTLAVPPSSWTEVASGRADAAGVLTLTDTGSSDRPVTFYRVRATPATAGNQ